MANMPDASLDDAIGDFEKSRSLYPAFILNYYELAKSLSPDRTRIKKRVENLRMLLTMQEVIYDDARVKVIARQIAGGVAINPLTSQQIVV